MEKILDAFDNEIHVGDYVVSTFSAMSHFSSFTYVHKVVGFRYSKCFGEYMLVVDRSYPLDERGTTTEFHAKECLVTTFHNYINSQKRVLLRIRDERLHPAPFDPYTPLTSREMRGVFGTADWQRPYIPHFYYDKKANDFVLNHPQTRRRKARKTNRFVMTNTKIPPKPTFL